MRAPLRRDMKDVVRSTASKNSVALTALEQRLSHYQSGGPLKAARLPAQCQSALGLPKGALPGGASRPMMLLPPACGVRFLAYLSPQEAQSYSNRLEAY